MTMVGLKVLYELIIHTERIPPHLVEELIDAIGKVFDFLPGVDFKYVMVHQFPAHAIINTVFYIGTDEEEILKIASAKFATTPDALRAEAEVFAIPAVAYVIIKLILTAIIVLGIAYITYTLFARDPKVAYGIIGVLAIFSIGYLVTAAKR